MDPKEIRLRLITRGYTLTDIARYLAVSVQVVSSVIHGKRHSTRVKVHIAKLLGMSVNDLFPETIDIYGRPIRLRGRPPKLS